MPPQNPEEARWFSEHVQPHEVPLRAYLRHRFTTLGDIDDLVQETFIRILRARHAQPIQSARAFLFGIARRLALDHVRRQKRTSTHEAVTDFHALRVLEGGRDVAESVSLSQEVGLLAEAIDALPPRCREIIILRKLDGLSHREIGERLGISEETVQVQLGRGMHKCAAFLRARGVGRVDERKGLR